MWVDMCVLNLLICDGFLYVKSTPGKVLPISMAKQCCYVPDRRVGRTRSVGSRKAVNALATPLMWLISLVWLIPMGIDDHFPSSGLSAQLLPTFITVIIRFNTVAITDSWLIELYIYFINLHANMQFLSMHSCNSLGINDVYCNIIEEGIVVTFYNNSEILYLRVVIGWTSVQVTSSLYVQHQAEHRRIFFRCSRRDIQSCCLK